MYLEGLKRVGDGRMATTTVQGLGFCIVHTVNSETDRHSVHPDATVNPKSTGDSALQLKQRTFQSLSWWKDVRCTPRRRSRRRSHQSTRSCWERDERAKVAVGGGGVPIQVSDFEESTRSDAFFPEQDRLAADEASYGRKEHYAVCVSSVPTQRHSGHEVPGCHRGSSESVRDSDRKTEETISSTERRLLSKGIPRRSVSPPSASNLSRSRPHSACSGDSLRTSHGSPIRAVLHSVPVST